MRPDANGAAIHALRPWLLRDVPAALPPSAQRMLAGGLLPALRARGLVTDTSGDRAVAAWTEAAFRIVHAFSRRPWATQAELLEALAVAPARLRSLNAVIRGSDLLQRLILDEGVGAKYWRTVLPLWRSGALDAARTTTYRWPARIGIYPGVSCMFFCGFCGRNFAAKYPGTAIEDGNARFVDIFAASPPDAGPTFSFSGGLEPLTNPGVGALVRDAAAFGIRVPLITNGFMLTPQYLAKQPGLWQLDSLRVSLYGVDQASYARVTRRGDAFAQVRRNLIDFLRLRPRENRDLRVGINFIVLPGTADQIVPLARLIAEINDAAGADRGIDFLTLREDFSVPEEQSLPLEERRRLVGVFQEFDALSKRTCPGLDVDYGFALWALEQGIVGRPLAMVTERGMRPKAFPQVSVVVDLLGDVYLYREAGFLERPGVGRYCIGRISAARPLAVVVREFVEKGKGIEPLGGDPALLDAFDHVVTLLLNRMDADASAGFGPEDGPVRLSAR